MESKNREIVQKEDGIARREQAIASREQAMSTREQLLATKEKELLHKEKELQAKESKLKLWEQTLAQQAKELEVKAAAMEPVNIAPSTTVPMPPAPPVAVPNSRKVIGQPSFQIFSDVAAPTTKRETEYMFPMDDVSGPAQNTRRRSLTGAPMAVYKPITGPVDKKGPTFKGAMDVGKKMYSLDLPSFH